MIYDNPAARLKTILENGLKENKEQQCFAVWRKLLEAKDNREVFARLGKVMDLSREVVFLLQLYFPHQVESANIWYNPIENAFMHQQLAGKWESFSGHINVYSIIPLGLVADLLDSKLNAKSAKGEEISALADQINSLISEVENSSLEKSLKIYLLRALSVLLQALREYKITGAEAVLKQVESMVGHAHRDETYFSFLKDHELGQRILDNLNAVAATLTIYLGIPQLPQAASMILPFLPN